MPFMRSHRNRVSIQEEAFQELKGEKRIGRQRSVYDGLHPYPNDPSAPSAELVPLQANLSLFLILFTSSIIPVHLMYFPTALQALYGLSRIPDYRFRAVKWHSILLSYFVGRKTGSLFTPIKNFFLFISCL